MWLFTIFALTRACTILLAGTGATVDNSVMVAYSDDGDGVSDPRFVYVPAQNHTESTRPVWDDTEDYPRWVGYGRNPVYEPKDGEKETPSLGTIPQVKSTFGYSEATYGIQNEKGLSIVETSCSGRLYGSRERGAIMSIDQLSRLALERTSSAREAIKTMGALAEKYGFIAVMESPGTPYPTPRGQAGEGGEALGLADHENQEVWLFHILSDGDVGAIWVAQRIPDNHFAVCSNMFTIREVDFTDSENFMYSESMTKVAEKLGWWTTGTPFDFTAIYSAGEYLNKYYSGRRMWRAMDLVAPSLGLKPHYDDIANKPPYPFSVKPDTPVTKAKFQSILRDYYAGTEFDLSNHNLGGGAHGVAARFSPAIHKSVNGSWERSIGQFRTTYSYVVQIRPQYPLPLGAITWFGPHSSWGTAYMPFYAGSSHPPAYETPTPVTLDRNTAYWAFRVGLNYAYGRFNNMLPELRTYSDALEKEAEAVYSRLENQFLNTRNVEALFEGQTQFLERVPEKWWTNVFQLFYTWSDGFENRPGNYGQEDDDIYPGWFLKAAGYDQGPGYGSQ